MASVFGISDESFKKSEGRTFSDVVEEWGNKAMNELRESLRRKVRLSTSKQLEQSIIAMPLKATGNSLTVEIQAAEYWKFLNEGVQGVGGQMKDGTRWTNKSPKSPFSFKSEKKPSAKHFTQWAYLAGKSPFAVRETVFRSGIKANHFFDEVINEDFTERMSQDLADVISRTISVDFTSEFNDQ